MADHAATGAASSGKIQGSCGGNSNGFGAAVGVPVYQSPNGNFGVGVGVQGGGSWNNPSVTGGGVGFSWKF